MLKMLSGVVKAFCCGWKLDSLEYMSTGTDYLQGSISVEMEEEVFVFKRVPSMVVLGALITDSADPDVQIEMALTKGESALWANSDALLCGDIPLRKRFAVCVEKVELLAEDFVDETCGHGFRT